MTHEFRAGDPVLVQARFVRLSFVDGSEAVADELTPIYPVTEGLQQPRLRRLTSQALAILAQNTHDDGELLPRALRERLALPALH